MVGFEPGPALLTSCIHNSCSISLHVYTCTCACEHDLPHWPLQRPSTQSRWQQRRVGVTTPYSQWDPGWYVCCCWCWCWWVFMEEATFKAAEEEAGRQIDRPFSIAFQELGPRGGWRHGSIFWIVAQTQRLVCGESWHVTVHPFPCSPMHPAPEGRHNLSVPVYL